MEMKKLKLWNSPMEPLIQLFHQSKSIFAVANLCTFLNTFMEAHTDNEFKWKIKKAMINYGIPLVYEDIKQKI